ncbi:YxeA family protein [Furfurilactobacillus entadae]|uniref:hypothetical protein n=1 Tax=Furfurilactobacillus entadae TaxID=2922307 RepID=UPI0035E983D6
MKQIDRGTLAIGLLLLLLIVGANQALMSFRYGGTVHTVRVVGKPVSSFPVSLPGSVTGTGYEYRAVDASHHGAKRTLRFKTNPDQQLKFKAGDRVKLTVSRRYGVTTYAPVK